MSKRINHVPNAGQVQTTSSSSHGLPGNSTRSTFIDQANEMGWRLIRLAGKRPLDKGWPQLPGLNLQEAKNHQGNLGVICGEPSKRLFVVDIDGEIPKNLPKTPTVLTGSGGRHMYYHLPEDVELTNANKVGHVAPGVDIRWTGGQVVAPGSIHPETQGEYKWLPGLSPDDIPIALVPEWIVVALQPPPPTNAVTIEETPSTPLPNRCNLVNSLAADVRNAKTNTRNHTLNTKAYTLGGIPDISEEEIYEALLPAAIDAGLPEAEARTTIKSGIKAGRKAPLPITSPVPIQETTISMESPEAFQLQRCTDVANGNSFEEKFTGLVMHSDAMGWLVWDGKRFAIDPKGAREAAKEISKDIRAEIRELAETMDLRDRDTANQFQEYVDLLNKWAKVSASTRGVDNILKEAKTTPGINANSREFDGQPWLLNCQNGTIDLSTGELLAHTPEHGITKLAPVAYDPGATCLRWDQFLLEVFEGDLEVVGYVCRALGYSLSGDTSWQAWFLLHGNGENGKSRFVEVLRTVLGPDYCHEIDPEELCQQQWSKHTTERAALRGARYITSEETDEGRQLAESFIKALTGEGKIRARFMRQDSFEFEPTCKLWLSTNNKPVVKDTSHGFWRRVRLIPFNACFADSPNKDPNLSVKLKAEATGILAQLVKYAKIAHADGEGPIPDQMQSACERYRGDSDLLGEFLDEYTEEDPHSTLLKRELYQRYHDANAGKCETQSRFSARIKARGIPDVHTRKGAAWVGLEIKTIFSDCDARDGIKV